jgi:hypothetical protein
MNSFKKRGFVERRDAAAHAKRQHWRNFARAPADAAFAERRAARIASANTRRTVKNVPEIEKAEMKST